MERYTLGETRLASVEVGEELWTESEMPICWEAEVKTDDGRTLYVWFAAGPQKANGLDISETSCAALCEELEWKLVEAFGNGEFDDALQGRAAPPPLGNPFPDGYETVEDFAAAKPELLGAMLEFLESDEYLSGFVDEYFQEAEADVGDDGTATVRIGDVAWTRKDGVWSGPAADELERRLQEAVADFEDDDGDE